MSIKIVERHRRLKKPPELLRMHKKINELKIQYKRERNEGAKFIVLESLDTMIHKLEIEILKLKDDTIDRRADQVGLDKYTDIEKTTIMTVNEFRKLRCKKCDRKEKCQQTKARIMLCAARMK